MNFLNGLVQLNYNNNMFLKSVYQVKSILVSDRAVSLCRTSLSCIVLSINIILQYRP